mgnify:CR=1 FL=1
MPRVHVIVWKDEEEVGGFDWFHFVESADTFFNLAKNEARLSGFKVYRSDFHVDIGTMESVEDQIIENINQIVQDAKDSFNPTIDV